MSIDKIAVLIFSLAAMAATYWFFLSKEDKEVETKGDKISIRVEGGYNPGSIVVPLGKTTKLNFFRKDSSSCLEEVVLPEFKIRQFLPLNKEISVNITPKQKGEFDFSCGMGMFHGKLIVR